MIIKCSKCGASFEVDFESDIEIKIWNFDGEQADIEMRLLCDECDESFEVMIPYKMIPIEN
jgi:transcription elongation factor Elf1